MAEILMTYLFVCVLYSAYLMITIYIPVIDELKYVVEERWGLEMINKINRFSTFYLFVAWSMGIFFAPYLAYHILRYGHYNCLKTYKDILWLEVRHEALEIKKYGKDDS